MNIYKITFNHGHVRHIVAESYGEAETIWAEDVDRYPIVNIELISDEVMLSKKLTIS